LSLSWTITKHVYQQMCVCSVYMSLYVWLFLHMSIHYKSFYYYYYRVEIWTDRVNECDILSIVFNTSYLYVPFLLYISLWLLTIIIIISELCTKLKCSIDLWYIILLWTNCVIIDYNVCAHARVCVCVCVLVYVSVCMCVCMCVYVL